MITVREAGADDIPSITGFQIRMAWETEKLNLLPLVVTKGVNAVFDDPSLGKYYVAERGKAIVASLLITYEWSDWRARSIWWLQSVYVVPAYRRQGIFREMYCYIRDLAEKQDVAGLRLYVETGNAAARKTYESMGMSSEHYSFYEWMRY